MDIGQQFSIGDRRSILGGPRNNVWKPYKSQFVYVGYSSSNIYIYLLFLILTVYYIQLLCDIECNMLNIRLE